MSKDFIEMVLAAAITLTIVASIIATGNRIVKAVEHLDATSAESWVQVAENLGALDPHDITVAGDFNVYQEVTGNAQ